MTLARNGLAVTRPNATLDTPLAAALLLRSLGIWEIWIQLGPIIKLAASLSFSFALWLCNRKRTPFFVFTFFRPAAANGI
jgi:hypothetical protein